MVFLGRSARHLSEQYCTSSQTFSHFLRQVNGRPQVTQGFSGKSLFRTPFGIIPPSHARCKTCTDHKPSPAQATAKTIFFEHYCMKSSRCRVIVLSRSVRQAQKSMQRQDTTLTIYRSHDNCAGSGARTLRAARWLVAELRSVPVARDACFSATARAT